ncbi:hypothetical protein BAJT_06815 [Bacillus velezensis]|uniref:hypothetical protein n=1 Tax=Bacillus velezensis TaxID=492670 RepID=UPI0009B67476|nr:hypothetical protein [Bacillus velezensis]ARB33003.1 hypothetical protein BAJT_06815 [Bacillus velezensis]
MKMSRPQKIAGYAELFFKMHLITAVQKDEVITLCRQKKPLTLPEATSSAVFQLSWQSANNCSISSV